MRRRLRKRGKSSQQGRPAVTCKGRDGFRPHQEALMFLLADFVMAESEVTKERGHEKCGTSLDPSVTSTPPGFLAELIWV